MNPLIPTPQKLKSLSRLWVFFKPYKLRMLLAFVVLVIAAGSALSLPLVIRQIVDQGFFVQSTGQNRSLFSGVAGYRCRDVGVLPLPGIIW